MGRKPNQLILEFFDRGPKLEDASNRYRHTCKACGEHFPKGRVDSLIAHLTKVCQVISASDRQRALSQFRESRSGQDASSGYIPGGAKTKASEEVQRLTGLEALAEASRQIELPSNDGGFGKEDDTAIDPSLKEVDLYGQIFDGNLRGHNEYMSVSLASDEAAFPAFHYAESSSASPFMPPSLLPSNASTNQISESLPLIAASVSDLEATIRLTRVLPDGGGNGRAPGPTATISSVHATGYAPTWSSRRTNIDGDLQDPARPTIIRTTTYPRAIAMDSSRPFRGSEENLNPSKISSHVRIRGKFSEMRRKEVQEIRKKGACLRCRMLRKTCSGGNPCNSCANVETARLWKHPCIRTRIAHEFNLYSAGLYSRIAFYKVNHAKSGCPVEEYHGKMQLSHESLPGMITNYKILTNRSTILQHESYQPKGVDGIEIPERIILFSNLGEEMTSKVKKFAEEVAATIYSQEPSTLMRITLAMASEISLNRNDLLLSQVLELWVLTYLLAESESKWKICLEPAAIEDHPAIVPPYNEKCTTIDKAHQPKAQDLVVAQLRAAIEKVASALGKKILNDFERRLLQRSQCQGFETFLLVIVLLTCVERMCWLFKTWEDDELAFKWPLDNRPAHFTREGESFSDLVCMLSKMRSVPPKTRIDAVRGFLMTVDSNNYAATQWFESVKLSIRYLEERRCAMYDPKNSQSYELKYAAKLLVP